MRKTSSRTGRGKSAGRRLPWRRILVPIDFSKQSLRALRVAAPLARDSQAHLLLLSVIEPPAFVAGFEGAGAVVPDATLAKRMKEHLSALARRYQRGDALCACLVKRGGPAEVITRVARQENIDLIVLTTHGRTGLERLLIGSAAERVVRHAPCPVLVVRRS